MKRLLFTGAALLAFACPALAQVDGQLGGAVPVDVDHRLFGVHAGFSNRQSDLFAQLRMSFYPGIDFGFHGGLAHLNAVGKTRTVLMMGGDLKTRVAKQTETFPVDIALGGAIGVGNAQSFGILGMGPTVVASRHYELSGGRSVSPYGGALLLFTRSDIDGWNSTDVSLQLRAGAEFQPNPDFRIVVELQTPTSDPIDRHPKVLLGANFPF